MRQSLQTDVWPDAKGPHCGISFSFFLSIHTATPSLEDYEQVSVELKIDVAYLLGKK